MRNLKPLIIFTVLVIFIVLLTAIAKAEMKGPGNTTVSTDPVISRIAYDESDRVEYIGYANPKTGGAAEKWLIQKIFYDGSGNVIAILFAEGETSFDKEWDERENYDYR